MIKFFRKIRQRLLIESKFSKYLLYAAGEIFLVVIGILIAVKINSWNIKQNIDAANKIYLTKLIEELELNIPRLELLAFDEQNINKLPSLYETVGNTDSLLTLVTRGLQEKDLDFLLHKEIFSGGSQLNLHDATYEELLSTGKLYSLGSDSLILKLKNYYKRYEREVDYNRRWTDFAVGGMIQIEKTRTKMQLDFSRNPENFELQEYEWFFDPKSNEYIELQLGLRRLNSAQSHHLRKCEELMKDTEELIEWIQKEDRNEH